MTGKPLPINLNKVLIIWIIWLLITQKRESALLDSGRFPQSSLSLVFIRTHQLETVLQKFVCAKQQPDFQAQIFIQANHSVNIIPVSLFIAQSRIQTKHN